MKSFIKKWKENPYRIAASGLGVVAVTVLGNFMLAYIVDSYRKENLEDDIAHIDRVGGQVFRSPADCAALGHKEISCHISQEIALSKTRERGIQIIYNTEAGCVAKHGPCEKFTGVYFNGYTYEYPVYYQPLVVGWQAAQDDMKRAVPLYASPEAGKGYRFDGALVPLPEAQ